MKINCNITAENIELTHAIRSYVEEKVEHLEKFITSGDTSATIHIEIGKTTRHHHSGDLFKAEATLHTAVGDFVAAAEEADLYAAIDAMKDELEREVTTEKDKQMTLARRGARMIKDTVRSLWPF